jgi:hypothetical protein
MLYTYQMILISTYITVPLTQIIAFDRLAPGLNKVQPVKHIRLLFLLLLRLGCAATVVFHECYNHVADEHYVCHNCSDDGSICRFIASSQHNPRHELQAYQKTGSSALDSMMRLVG